MFQIILKSAFLSGLVLTTAMLVGCQDIKKKHPDFPKWGWWEKKNTATTQPTAANPSEAATPQPTKKPTGPETGKVDPQSATDPNSIQHRNKVWLHVNKLRDLDNYSADEQKNMIAHAQENLQSWYEPLDVDPPNMGRSDWVIIMVWDFMPFPEFQRAANNWKRVATIEKVKFPDDLTRRKLMKFVRKMQKRKPVAPAASGGGE